MLSNDELKQETSASLNHQSQYFSDANSVRFRLCCCHVRIWALVIGVLEIISITGYLLSSIGCFINGEASFGNLMGSLIGFVVGLCVISLMIEGVKKDRHLYLVPHLVMQILSIIGGIIGAIVSFALTSNLEEQKTRILIAAGIIMLLIAGVQTFFFVAILRCYAYLKEKFRMS